MAKVKAKKAGKKAAAAAQVEETKAPEAPLHEQIRARREELRLSRRAVADEAEIAVSRVWAAEQEDTEIADEDLDKIITVLNLALEELQDLQLLSRE